MKIVSADYRVRRRMVVMCFVGVLGWTLAGAAGADEAGSLEQPLSEPSLAPQLPSNDSSEVDPGVVVGGSPEVHLSPARPDCDGSWPEQVSGLAPEQQEWAQGINHRVYQVRVEERLIARLELMSLASPEACDVANQWVLRRNTVLVTYFPLGSESEEVQYEFEPDDDFFAQTIEIEAVNGTVRVLGNNFTGDSLMLELDLERLEAIYSDAVSVIEEPSTVLTADGRLDTGETRIL